ncbi:MAG TPA: alpha/beta fold hydrolase [Candidatus Binataceae bacterium]
MSETFVLVHGAWHGAWCWAAVINELEKRGDNALAIDLPGQGASRFDRAKVTLATYVDSAISFIAERDLKNVVLAGHSLGGLTISGVVQKIPHRIKRVVFITAMVPNDGERGAETLPPFPNSAEWGGILGSRTDGSLPPEAIGDPFRKYFIQDASRDLQDFVLSALQPQPMAPANEPVSMKEFYTCGVPQSYIICEDDISPNGARGNWHPHFTNRLKNPTTRTIRSGHEVMFTKPAECAQALYELARS